MATTKKTTAELQAAAKLAKKPQSIDDLAPDEVVSDAEEDALADDGDPRAKSGAAKLAEIANKKSASIPGAPDWAIIPADLIIPKGAEVAFFNIPLAYPAGTFRQIIIWELGSRDERMARARAFGEGTRLVEELTKQMIRTVDGKRVDWGNPLEVEKTWDEIGPKYRSFMQAWYMKAHQLDEEERITFFANGVAALRAV